MTEIAAKPKRDLVLDMDWISATLGLVFFLVVSAAVAASAWRLWRGVPAQVQVTWTTVFNLLWSGWLSFAIKVRPARFALGVLSLSFGSRIAFAVVHLALETQTVNAEVMRVVELLIMVGFWLCIPYWFWKQLKHV
jgi:hypothetical protein